MILTKLKNSLLYKELLNNFFLLALDVVILIYTFDYIYTIVLLIIFNLYLYKRNYRIFKICIITIILITILFVISKVVVKDKGYNEYSGIVISVEEKERYNKLTIRKMFEKVIVYDYSFSNVNISDKVYVKGVNSKIEKNSNEYEFNYYNYLISKTTISIIKGNVHNVEEKINLYTLKKYIYKYLNSFENESRAYIKALVFGDNTLISEDSKEKIQINGISHLFAISGLHISLLISILERILQKMKIKKSNQIICVFLAVYSVLTSFQISVLRAVFMHYLKVINKRYDLKLSSLDIISVLFILFIIANPLVVYNMSFKLSFLASFIIILISQTMAIYNVNINGVYSMILMTVVVQIGTFPIVINLNNSYNLFSILANILFVYLISYILLPFSFMILFLPFLKNIYQYVIIGFEKVNIFIGTNFNVSINFPSFDKIEILIFYILLILLLTIRNRKIIIAIVLFLFMFFNKANLNIYGKVTFLSLYEGDAIVVDLPLNKGIVIIDTGTGSGNTLSNYLRASGIRKIDYLVLTHNHLDHIGEGMKIINEFNVSNVLVHAYDNSELSKLSNACKIKAGDYFTLSNVTFKCLNPTENNHDENNNAIVLEAEIGGLNYLFLSDVSKEVEDKLKVEKVDIVKVGHHGSKTSTSEKFYNKINPKYVIITPGDNEKYGFPHDETMEILDKYKVYRTDIDKQIIIKFFKNKSIISTVG